METNIERSENQKDICTFENCNRIANYRRHKFGNCHLKIQIMNFVVFIVLNGLSTKNSLIKPFLINKEYH